MVETSIINPCEHPARCEEYLSQSLESHVRFVHAEPLTASTRAAPWRLDVEVNGALRRYVLRFGSGYSEHEYTVLRAMEALSIPTPRAYGWDLAGETFGAPCFLCDFVEGKSMLGPVLSCGKPFTRSFLRFFPCELARCAVQCASVDVGGAGGTMPIYSYQCDKCGMRFDKLQKFTDKPLTRCPECKGQVRRLIQPAGIVFKGSGWYITDSKSASSATVTSSKDKDKDNKPSDTGKKD